MYQGFSHFSGLLHCFVLAKLATSSIRVNKSEVLITMFFLLKGLQFYKIKAHLIYSPSHGVL